jgi:hypothetical protein
MPAPLVQWYSINPVEGKVIGLQIVFAPSRTSLRGAGVANAPDGQSLSVQTQPAYGAPGIVQIFWDEATPVTHRLELMAAYDGPPLVIRSATWRKSRPVVLWSTESNSIPDGLKGTLWGAQLENIWDVRDRQLLIELYDGIVKPPSADGGVDLGVDGAKAKLFFAQLDASYFARNAKTQPPNLVAPKPSSILNAANLTTWLQRRLWHRTRLAVSAPDEAHDPIIKDLSKSQFDLYKRYWDDGNGKIDHDAIAEAFCRFAAGTLIREPGTHYGQPDSDNFLLFAEFALAALCCLPRESAEERTFWQKVLRGMVASQEAYKETYDPGFGFRKRGQWSYTNRSKTKTDADFKKIWQYAFNVKYLDLDDNTDFEKLTLDNAKFIYSDELAEGHAGLSTLTPPKYFDGATLLPLAR